MNVIEVNNVSKKFRLGASTGDLRERFSGMFTRRSPQERSSRDFWALRDVSFSVPQGESFGIIGHNGSGKSTLLKLITGIYAPTQGSFKITGRVSALIEVGAGFHPDLTGRENVYLNGSVMGMRKREIDRHYDEIVAFAELEQFMDTPVKRYSSGMYTRLGFAVAAHVNPDIVLVDEVLAVGDESFQRKCMKKMHEMRDSGKTIVFISHAMGSVLDLCQRVMVLSHGQMIGIGEPHEVIDMYRNSVALERNVLGGAPDDAEAPAMNVNQQVRILSARVVNSEGKECVAIKTGEGVRLECQYRAQAPLDNPVLGWSLHRQDGLHLYGANSELTKTAIDRLPEGEGSFTLVIPSLPMGEGSYIFNISIGQGNIFSPGVPTLLDRRDAAPMLDVFTDSRCPGVVSLEHFWDQPSHLLMPNTANGQPLFDEKMVSSL